MTHALRHQLRRWLVVVAAMAAVLAGAAVAFDRFLNDDGTEFSALFDASVGLYPGSDVQVLGVPVGVVTAVEPEGESVRVTMRLDDDQEVAADTGAVIVAPTMVSDRFVQLTEPHTEGEALASGTTITRTAVPVEIDELYASLTDISTQLGPDGANRNGALSRFLDVAADNLEGQGGEINEMIGEFGKATGALANSDDDLFATIGNLDEFNGMLVEHDQGVADANRQLAVVSEYLAEDRDDLADAVVNLGDALAVLDDFIEDNRGHLATSVKNLKGPTQALVKQKKSLQEAVRTIPLALQNFTNAYDVDTNTVHGRGNLNELTLWSRNGLDASTSDAAPPVLLPGLGEESR